MSSKWDSLSLGWWDDCFKWAGMAVGSWSQRFPCSCKWICWQNSSMGEYTVFFSTYLLKKPRNFLMPEAIAWIRPRWCKMALLLSWTSEEKGQGNIIMLVVCITHWSVTEARVSCTGTNQLNYLALIRVVTLSTSFPLSCSLKKLWPAMAVGWNYTQANSSIGDGLRVDCTYTTWC